MKRSFEVFRQFQFNLRWIHICNEGSLSPCVPEKSNKFLYLHNTYFIRLLQNHLFQLSTDKVRSRNGWLSPILSSLRFQDDKTLVVR
jgi:hypothetical protein